MSDADLVEFDSIRRISRAEFDRMLALGIFDEEDVQLLDGVLVTSDDRLKDQRHPGIVEWLTARFIRSLDEGYRVRAQSGMNASEYSRPEPDVLVGLRQGTLLLNPADALLVIEVSNTSLRTDRRLKARIYAANGVPEYWIVNIAENELVVEVHTRPTPRDYRMIEKFRIGDVLRPASLSGVEIPVADIPWQPPTD